MMPKLSPDNPYKPYIEAYGRKLRAISNKEFAKFAFDTFDARVVPISELSLLTGTGKSRNYDMLVRKTAAAYAVASSVRVDTERLCLY